MATQGDVKLLDRGVKFQEFDQTVAINNQAGVGYYSSGITLNIPNGYTPVGIQWINDWVNMAIPLFRAYSNNDNIYLHFMCPQSITSGFHFKVIYAPKD